MHQNLLGNSRFYILVSSILLSAAVIALLRLHFSSDQLFYIRTQQIFGLLCLIYWYAALIISPVGYVIGKHRMKRIEFARRAIGVSAFYFALLHGAIALWGQLGGLSELQYLPTLFLWSLLAGGIGIGVLAVMAATSFDRVVTFMTYRKWKWLHRLTYVAWILVVLHVWTIGTHLAYTDIQMIAFAALVVLSGLELYRVTKMISEKRLHFTKSEFTSFFLALWACVVVAIVSIPVLVQNYHSRHADHDAGSHSEVQE